MIEIKCHFKATLFITRGWALCGLSAGARVKSHTALAKEKAQVRQMSKGLKVEMSKWQLKCHTLLFTLPRSQPYTTWSNARGSFDLTVCKIITEKPDCLQALTSKGVKWVNLNSGEFVLKLFGNQ
jgi:hypothetical protein